MSLVVGIRINICLWFLGLVYRIDLIVLINLVDLFRLVLVV